MIELIVTILIVLIGSAFCSGLEAALFAVPESRVHVYKAQGKRGAEALLKIKQNMSSAIILIVICNNIFNIVGSMMVGIFAAEAFGDAGIGAISAIMTILVIMFGEIVPKTLGQNNSSKISLFFAQSLQVALTILFPLVWIVERLTRSLRKNAITMTEEELAILSRLSHEEGAIEQDEHDMIQRVFKLNDLTATDLMTPKNEMIAYPISVELGHIEDKIYEDAPSRIPVYGENIDDIRGIVLRSDLLIALAQDRQRDLVEDFVERTLFVQPSIKADGLLPLFQKKRQHLAIVRDQEGKTLGVVTLEDVLEELVGDIDDETDEE